MGTSASRGNAVEASPLTEEQISYIDQLCQSDDDVAIEKLLRDGIESQKDDSKSMIKFRDSASTASDCNLLHGAICFGAVKCARLLVNAPHSWNVDLPNEYGWSSMHVGQGHENPEIMVIMAPFSTQMRPYPAEFGVFGDENILQYITTYLLWPQVALFDQPIRMMLDIEEKIKGTNYTIKTYEINKRGYNLDKNHYRQSFGLLCELLLANAELMNVDMMGDNRLLYDRITNLDSSRMWPIMPISKEFVNEHIECTYYPRCLEDDDWQVCPDIWKFHRFGRIETDPKDVATNIFIWSPPTLKEFARLVIRRCMVRRSEPLNNNSEEYMFPNQAILLKNMSLPKVLKHYMLFTNLPKSLSWDPTFYLLGGSKKITRVDIPRYGTGTAFHRSFVSDSFKSFYPGTVDS